MFTAGNIELAEMIGPRILTRLKINATARLLHLDNVVIGREIAICL